MNRVIETTAIVGSDGVLHLDLPVGEGLAGRQVSLTLRAKPDVPVEFDPPAHPANDAEYLAALDRLHGCVDDPTFVEPADGKGWRELSQEEYSRRVLGLAGSIGDPTFERPPQGEYEVRGSSD